MIFAKSFQVTCRNLLRTRRMTRISTLGNGVLVENRFSFNLFPPPTGACMQYSFVRCVLAFNWSGDLYEMKLKATKENYFTGETLYPVSPGSTQGQCVKAGTPAHTKTNS